MKQKFFTLLLGLAMVSLGAVAQETVPVSISATIGAKTFVCDKDLDFSSFNSNASGIYDFNLVPYYVSGYNVTSGNFALTRFESDHVPANTPMILLGKQHSSGTIPGNVKNFDVPVINMALADANPAKRKVWSNNYSWLVPVMNTSYNRSICLLDNEGNENLDGEGNQIMNNVVFFDNTGISSGAKLLLNQTENVQVGVTKDTTTTYMYYPIFELSLDDRSQFNDDVTDKAYIYPSYYSQDTGVETAGVSVGGLCVLYTPEKTTKPKKSAIYALFQLVQDLEDTEDPLQWKWIDNLSLADKEYDESKGKWKRDSIKTITSTPITENYTQYFLGANGITPVFKKCNSSGTNGVNYGGAYVRVWSTLLGGAAAREDLSFEIFDEDGTEISYQNDEVTGIRSLQNTVNAKKENRQIYNLQGQKLDKMQRGLNIVGGKKYFVK